MLPLSLPDVGSDVGCGGKHNIWQHKGQKHVNELRCESLRDTSSLGRRNAGPCEESCSPSEYYWLKRRTFVLNLSTLWAHSDSFLLVWWWDIIRFYGFYLWLIGFICRFLEVPLCPEQLLLKPVSHAETPTFDRFTQNGFPWREKLRFHKWKEKWTAA